jgi:anti-sigma factor RsiW
MRCAEFVELASDYLDGTLEEAAARRVAGHLGCPGCAEYLAQLRRTVELLGLCSPASDRAWRSAGDRAWRRS